MEKRTRGQWWKPYALLVAGMLVAACSGRELESVAGPMTGASATRASYAYSTEWGDMYEVDGELLPAAYSTPWDAVISGQTSNITWSSGCSWSNCTVYFNAWMTGLWHTTTQSISWEVAGQSGTSDKTNFGWSCIAQISPLNCAMAERKDRHEVSVQGHCSWLAKINTTHAAWWGAWFDLEIFGKKIGQIGRTEKSSIGPNKSFDDCASTPPPGGGGGGNAGDVVCYEFYLYWWDTEGYHEVYVGTECYEGYAT